MPYKPVLFKAFLFIAFGYAVIGVLLMGALYFLDKVPLIVTFFKSTSWLVVVMPVIGRLSNSWAVSEVGVSEKGWLMRWDDIVGVRFYSFKLLPFFSYPDSRAKCNFDELS